jgi:hypothetical protein
MKIAILITGHVRNSLEFDNLNRVINEINKIGQCDIFGYTSNKKDHSTKTWYETNKQYQNEVIDYDRLNKFLNFKNLFIYEEPSYDIDTINLLWGKSPLSYVGVKQLYLNIHNCLQMVTNEHDYVFRLRFDYNKFDYANYTNNIINILKNTDVTNDNVTAIKIGSSRGEDSFFFSKKHNFIKVIQYIIDNFYQIEKYAKNVNENFIPEDMIRYSCMKQNINFVMY